MRILITAGPTREPIDDVRYLSNGSSGRMGYALAQAAQRRGHTVVLVSGPVELPAPSGVELVRVVTTDEMYHACQQRFPDCDGLIAAAAVCDYRPRQRIAGKLKKTGRPLTLELVETIDVLASLAANKGHRWVVGFAVEPDESLDAAHAKLLAKNCDWIVVNAPSAIGAADNRISVIDRSAQVVLTAQGPKAEIAERLMEWIERSFGSPTDRAGPDEGECSSS